MNHLSLDERIAGARWRNEHRYGFPVEIILVMYKEQQGADDLTFFLEVPNYHFIAAARKYWRKHGYKVAKTVDINRG